MSERPVSGPSIENIRDARRRLEPYALRTPLLEFNGCDESANIFLKLENLQPIGAFKVRSMGNAMLTAGREMLDKGAYTASSGNAGLGLAWMARALNIAARVYAPVSAPAAKLQRIRHLGASVHSLSESDWWQIIRDGGHPGDSGVYVDAVRNPAAMAGNGTIGVEILEQLPEVETVIVPFGGGGLACGIACAFAALKPDVRIIVAEAETAAPVTAALRAGRPTEIPVTPSFISGAGAPCVLSEMWPLLSRLVHETRVVSIAEVEETIRVLSENNRVVAEGAGALSVAAARAIAPATGTTVCVVTGGNIDPCVLGQIICPTPVSQVED